MSLKPIEALDFSVAWLVSIPSEAKRLVILLVPWTCTGFGIGLGWFGGRNSRVNLLFLLDLHFAFLRGLRAERRLLVMKVVLG